MNSIQIGRKKQASNKIQFFPNKQHVQQHSIASSKHQAKVMSEKTVRFDCPTPAVKENAFQNTKHKRSKKHRTHSDISNDDDFTASSTKDLFANQASINNNKSICAARSMVIGSIIVAFIMIAVGVSVGTMFGIMNSQSQQNSSTASSGNNNQNSFSTISSVATTSSISIGSQSGTPCTSYTTINDPLRSITNDKIFGTCDTGSMFNGSNDGSWIRFVGSGGTIIPMTSPGLYVCGGYLSGWFNGTLPNTVGNVVNGTACFDSAFKPCHYALRMSVVNCGGYYIYRLRPVYFCNARYCTT